MIARSTPPGPGGIVFDSEAILAFFYGEEGHAVAASLLGAVTEGTTRGFLNEVNAAEVRYVVARQTSMGAADEHLDWLRAEARVQLVSSEEVWQKAAAIKAQHPLSLGDAFALATAHLKNCPVLTGSDPEFEAAHRLGIQVRRVR